MPGYTISSHLSLRFRRAKNKNTLVAYTKQDIGDRRDVRDLSLVRNSKSE